VRADPERNVAGARGVPPEKSYRYLPALKAEFGDLLRLLKRSGLPTGV